MISKMTLKSLVWPCKMWTIRCRQNLNRTGRSGSDCSFRFADFTWFSICLFDFRQKFKCFFFFFSFFPLFFFRSEQQLSASTDLEQPRNANVIEKNTWQTKCRLNISCGFLRFAIYHRVERVHIPFMVYSRHKDSITRL